MKRLAIIVAVLLLAGCSLPTPAPYIQQYKFKIGEFAHFKLTGQKVMVIDYNGCWNKLDDNLMCYYQIRMENKEIFTATHVFDPDDAVKIKPIIDYHDIAEVELEKLN